jgi:hypothetical protein
MSPIKEALLAPKLALPLTLAGFIALEPIVVEREVVGTEAIDRLRQDR